MPRPRPGLHVARCDVSWCLQLPAAARSLVISTVCLFQSSTFPAEIFHLPFGGLYHALTTRVVYNRQSLSTLLISHRPVDHPHTSKMHCCITQCWQLAAETTQCSRPSNTPVVSHFSNCPRFQTRHLNIVDQTVGINISSGGEETQIGW